jgi:hypothetical protein
MFRLFSFGVFFTAATLLFSGCKNTDPSVMKIFVRSASNELVSGAKVVVIGDVDSNPPTGAFVDTAITNTSGFAVVDMDQYFNTTGAGNTTGYFDVLVSKNLKSGSAYVRCRVHVTAVETIFLMN